ncbi:malate dehydrogenase (quinone) [Salinispirillum marinum]|uniref:Probable malate:quinone oxidoreductase n=2 Tax=Saccharospirillaceae TaxID=255527 RepID=A0ABV8BFH0_9GAMM
MSTKIVDVMLVGAGAMSATLGNLLKHLDPSLTITMIEKLDAVAMESSDGMNNAGTGHAAYCELNYTPEKEDGTLDLSKAFDINGAFERSLQFWSYLVKKGALPEPRQFINPVPHLSFVWGEKNVEFLRKRYEAMGAIHLFSDMEYSEDHAVLKEWMPLVMQNRDPNQPVAATRVSYGSDVDFGSLTRNLVKNLEQSEGFNLLLSHRVETIRRQPEGHWTLKLRHEHTGESQIIGTRFLFLGAGGAALPLLHKSGIPEAEKYGGFPVSGQWLVCDDPNIVEQHRAKVYGKAAIGAPPMSVPHLDTRIINGKPALLFGPFAGFTTKFLKNGSVLDLPKSVNKGNLLPMLSAGIDNLALTKYLMTEVMQSHEDRMNSLREFYPDAKSDQWKLAVAGQRVQIIKHDPKTKRGKLEFGTEVVTSADGSLAALLGASPGASTAVKAMIEVLSRCFKERLETEEWDAKMKEMIPSFGKTLRDEPELLRKVRAYTLETLQLR